MKITLTPAQLVNLKNIGNIWTSPDGSKNRVYIKALQFVLSAEDIKKRWFTLATLDGQSLSNTKARSLAGRFDMAKFFFDLDSGEFKCDTMDAREIGICVEKLLKLI